MVKLSSMKSREFTTVGQTEGGLVVAQQRIPVDAMNGCITQVQELGGDRRRTCYLTSALNALVMTGSIDTDTAQGVQDTLVTDPAQANNWVAYRQQARWTNDVGATRQAIGQVLGRDVPLRAAPASAMGRALEQGHAVVAVDPHHARVLFQPDEGTLAVHDPLVENTTGEYRLDQASGFHLAERPTNMVV
jgi:hypothetical protein